jgi:hypothetical protein
MNFSNLVFVFERASSLDRIGKVQYLTKAAPRGLALKFRKTLNGVPYPYT